VRCSELLVAYAYGKPNSEQEATVDNEQRADWIDVMTQDELVTIARGEQHPLTDWLKSKGLSQSNDLARTPGAP